MRRKQMNFKNKKVTFFDMDGTLIDSETLYYQTRVKVFRNHDLTWSKAENDHLLAGGFAATLHYMQKKVGDPELGKQLSDESLALYQHLQICLRLSPTWLIQTLSLTLPVFK